MRKVAEVEEVANMTGMEAIEILGGIEVLMAEVTEVLEEDIKMLIVYSPMYGHISRMAEAVKEGERT
jgi:hypothetical protein